VTKKKKRRPAFAGVGRKRKHHAKKKLIMWVPPTPNPQLQLIYPAPCSVICYA